MWPISSQLIPDHPEDFLVIRDITPNVTTFSVPFSRQGVFEIGGRATLVRLSSGSLVIFSPIALTDAVLSKIEQFGNRLDYIIAPDMEHHIFISEWKSAFPKARVIGPEGLPEKRARQVDEKIQEHQFFAIFEAAVKRGIAITSEFDADFEYEYVDAHINKEIVFFYKPDRVLIEADLLFNLPAYEQYSKVFEPRKAIPRVLNDIFNHIFTTDGDLKWARRFHWYITASKDRKGFTESIRRIGGWNFHIIIPCHGDVIKVEAKERFWNLFQWYQC